MKTLFAALGIATSVVVFLPYLRDLRRGTTKPHVFTWLVWAVSGSIVLLAQATHGGGLGSFIIAMDVAACTFVTIWAIFKGSQTSLTTTGGH